MSEMSSNAMMNSEDLTQEELSILQSDLVGNSAHSARWIIGVMKCLVKVPEDGFSGELEEKYRLLFEISSNTDVKNFLILHNFINLATSLLDYFDEPLNLIEITIGILANLCHDEIVIDLIAEKTNIVEKIFGFLKSYDLWVLIQIIRFLQLVVRRINNNSKTIWYHHIKNCEYLGECIIFILKSSFYNNLLIETISLLYYMAWAEFEATYILVEVFQTSPDTLVPGMLECFLEIIKEQDVHSFSDLKIMEK
ncbi:uncharacterized protein LOC105189750 isoform X2 [Harpegnathos saltator]|nr:uncharacterized protein LOC105189750 isoform X2 [Harpegnathos saltator]